MSYRSSHLKPCLGVCHMVRSHMCGCMYVCVRERERDIERERARLDVVQELALETLPGIVSRGKKSYVCMYVCERQRESKVRCRTGACT